MGDSLKSMTESIWMIWVTISCIKPPIPNKSMSISQSNQSESIISNYLVITGLYTLAASVIWGVNTLFLLDAGLSLFEVFIANAVFTGSMALFELPTGVLADTRGRKYSFILSIMILFLGTLGYVFASSMRGGVIVFVIMSIVLGVGFTFYSGALEAWLVDALNTTGYQDQLDRVFARGAIVSGAAMLIGSIGGGIFGQINLTMPYYFRLGLLMAVLVFAYITMRDIGFSPQHVGWKEFPGLLRQLTQASIQYGWNKREVRFIILAGMIQATIQAWGFYAWQPYFLELLGKDSTWVAGVIAALIALFTIAGNSLVEWFSQFCGRRTTLLLWSAGISTLALTGVGLTTSFWLAVPLYLLASGAAGVTTPVKQAYLHQVTPSSHRATVISFDSMLASGGSMVGQSGLGYISQRFDLNTGYVTGGLATIFAVPVIGLLRKLDQPGDYIVGKAGKNGVCPAQGLPGVSALDADAGLSFDQQENYPNDINHNSHSLRKLPK
jgi:MFS family permease